LGGIEKSSKKDDYVSEEKSEVFIEHVKEDTEKAFKNSIETQR
jgi:hypothetical protein